MKTTLVTGTGITVTVAVAMMAVLVMPSALIVVVPAFNPVTTPVCETVATVGSDDVQVMERMATAAPEESLPATVNWAVPPTTMGFAGPVSVSEKSDASVERIVSVPVTPSVTAEMTAVPGPTAVTVPLAATVTAAVLLDENVKVFPAIAAPADVDALALTVPVRPTVRRAGPVTITVPTTGTGGTTTTCVVSTGGCVGASLPQPENTASTATEANSGRRSWIIGWQGS